MQTSSLDETPRVRRSRTPWIIGGVVAFVMLLLLGAVASVAWFGISTFNDQAYAAIRADPAIVDAMGSIKDIQFDFENTGDAPGAEEFAYRIIGERASGLLVGRFVTVSADIEDLREGKLTLQDGRVIQVGTAGRSD